MSTSAPTSALDYLFKHYEDVLGWYQMSEGKAQFIVGLNTLVVGAINGVVFVGADDLPQIPAAYARSVWVLLAAVGVSATLSFLFVLRSIWPRHRTVDPSPDVPERLWFFGNLARMTRQEYEAAVGSWSEGNLTRAMIAQNHKLSQNVWKKHDALNWAIACTIVSLLFLLAFGVLYGIALTSMPSPPVAPTP